MQELITMGDLFVPSSGLERVKGNCIPEWWILTAVRCPWPVLCRAKSRWASKWCLDAFSLWETLMHSRQNMVIAACGKSFHWSRPKWFGLDAPCTDVFLKGSRNSQFCQQCRLARGLLAHYSVGGINNSFIILSTIFLAIASSRTSLNIRLYISPCHSYSISIWRNNWTPRQFSSCFANVVRSLSLTAAFPLQRLDPTASTAGGLLTGLVPLAALESAHKSKTNGWNTGTVIKTCMVLEMIVLFWTCFRFYGIVSRK